MRKYSIFIVIFTLTPLFFWQCTPTPPSENNTQEESASEAGAESFPEPLPELIAESTPFEPTPPDGPHEVKTLQVTFTFPLTRHVGDVKAIQGTAKSSAAPIEKLELALQNNTTALYWDGMAFSETEPKWLALPDKDSFSYDTSTIPFQTGGYTAYIRVTDKNKGYQVHPNSWRSGLPWSYLANRSAWRYLHGPIDGEFYVHGQRGVIHRVRDKGAFRIPVGVGPVYAMHVFQDPKLLLLAGEQAKIWRSVDGGIIWKQLKLDIQKTSDIYAISATRDDKTLIAGGNEGRLYRSDDQGETWRILSEQRGERIRQICRVSENQWLVLSDQGAGSALYLSDIGGNNWSSVTLPITDRRFYGLGCSEKENVVLLIGDGGKILRSEDDGRRWTETSSSTRTTDLRGIWQDKNEKWWVVGAMGHVLESSDGKSFQSLSGPDANQPTLWDIRLEADGKQGFAWGEQGAWLQTKDGGKTWSALLQPVGPAQKIFYAANFPLGPRAGYVVGETGIFSTEDAGQTWNEQRKGGPYYDMWFRDNQIGFVVGTEICGTEDAGKQWSCQPLGVDGPLYSVDFSSEKTGCAVGAKGALLCSVDSGKTWQQGILATGEDMRQIHFVNQEVAYVVGNNGSIFRSKDNGKNWLPVSIEAVKGKHLYNVSFPLNDDIGYLGGAGGLLLKTEDRGTTWKPIDLKTTQDIRLVHFPLNLTEGYVLAGSHHIYHTDDNGVTWNLLPSLSAVPLTHFNFSQSPKLGFAVGEDGTVLLTTNSFQ